MRSAGFYKLLSALYTFLLLKVVYSLPLEENALQSNSIAPKADVKFPGTLDQETYFQTRSQTLEKLLYDEPNPVLNEMFDNITLHYNSYSKYLQTAPTTELMILRIKMLKDYSDIKGYTGAVAKFDKFVQDFRPNTRVFDKFAFSTVDFLMFPGLNALDYTPSELKRIRADVIKTIPTYLSQTERNDFIAVVDTLIPQSPDSNRAEANARVVKIN